MNITGLIKKLTKAGVLVGTEDFDSEGAYLTGDELYLDDNVCFNMKTSEWSCAEEDHFFTSVSNMVGMAVYVALLKLWLMNKTDELAHFGSGYDRAAGGWQATIVPREGDPLFSKIYDTELMALGTAILNYSKQLVERSNAN